MPKADAFLVIRFGRPVAEQLSKGGVGTSEGVYIVYHAPRSIAPSVLG